MTESGFQETGSQLAMQPWRNHSPKPALATSPGMFGCSLHAFPQLPPGHPEAPGRVLSGTRARALLNSVIFWVS